MNVKMKKRSAIVRRKKKPLKHQWIKDSGGEIDCFAYESGEYHNGPKCERCGFEFCHHCNPEGYETECGKAEPLPASDSNLDGTVLAMVDSFKRKARP